MTALAVKPETVSAPSMVTNPVGVAIGAALAVDDDPLILGILEAYLTKIGVARIKTLEDGYEALSLLENDAETFDLICCDLNMPNLDGVAFLRQLSECGFCGDVIIISGEHDAIRRTAEDFAAESGLSVLGSLRKPFDPRQFDSLIAKRRPPRRPPPQPAAGQYPPRVLFAEEGGILPFFQPQVCSRTGVIKGVEALARLQLGDDSIVSPFHFFDTISKHGLWYPLFERMFEKGLAEQASWLREGHEFTLSVNIDAGSLCEISLPDRVRALTAAAGVEPFRIVLELTEDTALAITARMLEVIARLRIFGFKVSIDDFGKGYSNFERLQRLPFTELKIDQQFVVGAKTDAISAACVASSVALARVGGFTTVAEGVSSEADLDYVRASGIDLVQGYLVSEPLSANAFRRFARASSNAPLF